MKFILQALVLLLPFSLFSNPILSPTFSDVQTEKLILDNGLKAYIISDPLAEKSAAALSVNTGSWENPKEHLGLAHFLEHMLFLGTKKYPKESSYQQFIEEHGGKTNAFTQGNYTTYLFDTSTPYFEEVLDRFSEFFKEPLLNPSGVNREKNAVAQEHAGNVEKDALRRYEIWRTLGNPNHPENHFQTGDLETLKTTTTKVLRKWYEKHYSANLMTLVIYSPLPMESLQNFVTEKFSSIENKNREPFRSDKPLRLPTSSGKVTFIQPIKDLQTLTFVWEMPKKFSTLHLEKPDEIISFIMGHEGEESLLAQLKREGLAESLAAGSNNWRGEAMVYYVQIELTNKGVQNPYKVIERVFQGIQSFKETGIPRYLYDDIHKITTLKYQFPNRKEPYEEVKEHSIYLQEIPLEDYPEHREIPQTFSPKLYQEFLSLLTPERCAIDLMVSPEKSHIEPDRLEERYQIAYAVRKVPEKSFEKWKAATAHSNITVPKKNVWLPEDIQVEQKKVDKSFPKMTTLSDNGHGVFYYSADSLFLTAKSVIKFQFKSPLIDYSDPRSIVLTELYIESIKDRLNTLTYEAKMAGLNYTIEREEDTLALTILGYSDKISEFIENITDIMKSGPDQSKKFEVHKSTLNRKYKNYKKNNPLKIAIEQFREVIYKYYTTDEEKTKAIATIHLEDYKNFLNQFWDKTYTRGFAFGSIELESAKKLWNNLQTTIASQPFPIDEQIEQEVATLPQNEGPYFLESKTASRGNALLVTIEQPSFTFKRLAAQEILSKSIGKAFFSELRTRQQTAYLIGQVSENIREKLLNIFALESHSHDPRDLLARTHLMIEDYLQQLPDEETFETIKTAYLAEQTAPPENLKEMGKKLSELSFSYQGDFSRQNKKIEGIKELTYSEFLEISQEILSPKNRQRIAILIKGALSEKDDVHYTKAKSLKWLREKSAYSKGGSDK